MRYNLDYKPPPYVILRLGNEIYFPAILCLQITYLPPSKCIWTRVGSHMQSRIWLSVGTQLWFSCRNSSEIPVFISSFTSVKRKGIHFPGMDLNRGAVEVEPEVGTDVPSFLGTWWWWRALPLVSTFCGAVLQVIHASQPRALLPIL